MASEFVDTTLVDGFADGPHITEKQIGLANQGAYGPDDYVLETGRQAEAQILTNNSIRIFDAVYVIQGRRDVIAANDYTDVSIDNGAQGMNRNDIIVRRYEKDEGSEIESTSYAVIKGTPSSGTAADPDITEGDIRSGATLHEMKLCRVKLEGLNIVAVEPLFKVLMNMSTLNASLLSILQPTFEEIYNSSLGTVWGAKIGRIAILRWAVIAADSPARTIRLGSKYAPAANAALPLTKNGELLGRSWFSRNTDTGMGELEYYTKSGVNETYTGWVAYITYS